MPDRFDGRAFLFFFGLFLKFREEIREKCGIEWQCVIIKD
ncbi:hypothetical protein SBF1_7600002 [Candidatus Desulfosporosinus infrequens]|uniref:Uncharacterized protein n=1 Tax=Candidatus Desulfosporosinus infrequens TaxID=2043169 RepID=A0A2U3LRB8_9FIRM|nr:hypothetical protein SBF1_7600002 [Candidatus Desulfosporosinus infrequens]